MNIGFMQGRLSNLVDGRIQSFPWLEWESEFSIAKRLGLSLMEWTLDQEKLYQNPLMTVPGRERITQLSSTYDVHIPSVTCDCFMQAPFFKTDGLIRRSLLRDLQSILDASRQVGIRYIVLPLVDNGSIQTHQHQEVLSECLLSLREYLLCARMKILFESDFAPDPLASFIDKFPRDSFGINYDIGNSAALGYSYFDEFGAYGHRIDNVHVKDRVLHGATVPLGTGNANFPGVFQALHNLGYTGDFILQTARAEDNDHVGAISRFRDLTLAWLSCNGS